MTPSVTPRGILNASLRVTSTPNADGNDDAASSESSGDWMPCESRKPSVAPSASVIAVESGAPTVRSVCPLRFSVTFAATVTVS